MIRQTLSCVSLPEYLFSFTSFPTGDGGRACLVVWVECYDGQDIDLTAHIWTSSAIMMALTRLASHRHGSNGPVLNNVQLGQRDTCYENNTAENLSHATKSCSRGVNRGQSASNIDPLQIRVCECEHLTVMVSEPQFWLRLSAPFSGERSLLFVSK
jgi:hypothetical protein